MAGKPDPAEHVSFKEAEPVFIRNLLERFQLEDAEIVDEHIDIGQPADQQLTAVAAAEICRDTIDGRARQLASQPRYRVAHARFCPAIHRNVRALARQRASGCEPDAGR